jgi:hypothetical protein
LLGLKENFKAGSALAGHDGAMQPTAALLRMRALAPFIASSMEIRLLLFF